MAVTAEAVTVLAVTGAAPGALDAALVDLARRLEARGVTVAGVVQRNTERPGRRCDMDLEVLTGGARVRISEDRGALASGCRLHAAGFAQAVHAVEQAMALPFDVFILNKFGAREEEGAGFRPALATALLAGAPAVVGVSAEKHAALEAFVGAPVARIAAEDPALWNWVQSHWPAV